MPRKRVAQGVFDDLPEIKENQRIVKMLQVFKYSFPSLLPCALKILLCLYQPKGNHLYEVMLPNSEITLCRMPPKFRNLVWVKRGCHCFAPILPYGFQSCPFLGDFLIIEVNASSTKVTGDILHILYDKQIRHLQSQNLWPSSFDLTPERKGYSDAQEEKPPKLLGQNEDDDEDDNDPLFRNPNHAQMFDSEDEEEEEEGEGEEGEEGKEGKEEEAEEEEGEKGEGGERGERS